MIHLFPLSIFNYRVVSAIQAGLSCLFGVLVCQWSCSRNFLTTSHVFSESYAWFGASYFIYDIWSMFVVYNTKIYDKMQLKLIKWDQNVKANLYSMIPSFGSGELSLFKPIFVNNEKIPSFVEYMKKTPLMIFHHMFIGSYGLIVISSLRGGLGDCIFSFMFMMEFSTPFVSFRAILSIIKLKNSKLYFINGLMMVISFLVCRIIMLPTLMYVYSTIVKLSFLDAVVGLPLGCQISILCLFLPQFYWFHLMVKGVLKVRIVNILNKKKQTLIPLNTNEHLCYFYSRCA